MVICIKKVYLCFQMKNIKGELACCYCGGVATTREHIPPKGIFNKPLPSDLITVPCCLRCNQEGSVNDEILKTYLGLHVAIGGGEAERLFKERVLPTTKHNQRLRQIILNSMRPVHFATETGIIYGRGSEIIWDNEAHDIAIERIAKGLFFYHYKKALLNIGEKSIYWFDTPLHYNIAHVEGWHSNSIGNGTFKYYYDIVEEGSGSVWLFNFYDRHFAGAIFLTDSSEEKIL
jgi:hypothetical protein